MPIPSLVLATNAHIKQALLSGGVMVLTVCWLTDERHRQKAAATEGAHVDAMQQTIDAQAAEKAVLEALIVVCCPSHYLSSLARCVCVCLRAHICTR